MKETRRRSLGGIVFLLAIVSVAAIYFAGTHYVVLMKTTTTTLRKESFSLLPVFLDIRDWTPIDVARNPDVASLFLKQGKGRLLPGGAVVGDAVEGLKRGVDGVGDLAREGRQATKEFMENAVRGFPSDREELIVSARKVAAALMGYKAVEHVYPKIANRREAERILDPYMSSRIPDGLEIWCSESGDFEISSARSGEVLLTDEDLR